MMCFFAALTLSPKPPLLRCCSGQVRCSSDADLWRSLHALTPRDVAHAWGAKRMRVSPVKACAAEHGVPTLDIPDEGLASMNLPAFLTTSPAPLLVTASFGHRIPASWLRQFSSPSLTLNLHPSMLPKLRGAAPIQWAIARQHATTGITVQQLHPHEFDHGEILQQCAVEVPPDSTYLTLLPDLARRGAELLVDVIAALPARHASAHAQDGAVATRAPKLQPKFSVIRWDRWDAATMDARLRGFGYMVRVRPNSATAHSHYDTRPRHFLYPCGRVHSRR